MTEKRLIPVGIVVMVIYALTVIHSNGYHQPDEHYQIIEFACLKGGWNTGAIQTIIGVVTLTLALVLNLRYALDDYGMRNDKLHVEVLAQATSTGGSSTSGSLLGPTKETRVHCTGTTGVTITVYGNGKTSNGWTVGGSVSAGWSIIGASLLGQYGQGSSNSSGGSTTSITVASWDFWADKIYCQGQINPCKPYDPCAIN